VTAPAVHHPKLSLGSLPRPEETPQLGVRADWMQAFTVDL